MIRRRALGRTFTVPVRAACKACRRQLWLHRSRHSTSERELVCDACWSANRESLHDPALQILSVPRLTSPLDVLETTLEELGIPPLHVLAVEHGDTTRWIELTGDADRVLPERPSLGGAGPEEAEARTSMPMDCGNRKLRAAKAVTAATG